MVLFTIKYTSAAEDRICKTQTLTQILTTNNIETNVNRTNLTTMPCTAVLRMTKYTVTQCTKRNLPYSVGPPFMLILIKNYLVFTLSYDSRKYPWN